MAHPYLKGEEPQKSPSMNDIENNNEDLNGSLIHDEGEDDDEEEEEEDDGK